MDGLNKLIEDYPTLPEESDDQVEYDSDDLAPPRGRKFGPLSVYSDFRKASLRMLDKLHSKAKIHYKGAKFETLRIRFNLSLQYQALGHDRSFITIVSAAGDTPEGEKFRVHNSKNFMKKFINSNSIAWSEEEFRKIFERPSKGKFVCILCGKNFPTMDDCRVHHVPAHCSQWEDTFGYKLLETEEENTRELVYACEDINCAEREVAFYTRHELIQHREEVHEVSEDSEYGDRHDALPFSLVNH